MKLTKKVVQLCNINPSPPSGGKETIKTTVRNLET